MAEMLLHDDISRYLEDSHYIDWKNKDVLRTAKQLFSSKDEIESIRNVYHFVRDGVRHSWDIQDRRITITASDVLREKVGICWAKANLLAGLLRASGVPAGICYQRLTLGDTPESGYCVHALNAVYIKSLGRWIRIDARGNKAGINAELDVEQERLAFRIRPEMDEADYPVIYAQPLKITMDTLENSTDAIDMCLHSMPERI